MRNTSTQTAAAANCVEKHKPCLQVMQSSSHSSIPYYLLHSVGSMAKGKKRSEAANSSKQEEHLGKGEEQYKGDVLKFKVVSGSGGLADWYVVYQQ